MAKVLVCLAALGAGIVAMTPAVMAKEKRVLMLVAKDNAIQPALQQLCGWAGDGHLQARYSGVVWLRPTFDPNVATENRPPGDVIEDLRDQLDTAAASVTMIRSCYPKTSSPNPAKASDYLYAAINSQDPLDGTTIEFWLPGKSSKAARPDGPIYAHRTRLGDPGDLRKFVGCLAWHLWDAPQGLANPGTSCADRGLRAEPERAQVEAPELGTAVNPPPPGTPLPARHRWVRWAPPILTAVISGSAIAAGLLANSRFRELESSCGRSHSCSEAQIDGLRTRALITNLLFVGAALGAAGTVLAFYLGPRGDGNSVAVAGRF
jgi:hypothetical protein